MRFVMTVNGLDKVGKKFERLAAESPRICRKAVYEGAGPVADQLRANIEALPVSKYQGKGNFDPHTWPRVPWAQVWGLTESQKEGILSTLGISPVKRRTDHLDKKIGLQGYNDTCTVQYPNGQPNALILRSVESGTRWHKKYPVCHAAAVATEAICKQKMEQVIKDYVRKNF